MVPWEKIHKRGDEKGEDAGTGGEIANFKKKILERLTGKVACEPRLKEREAEPSGQLGCGYTHRRYKRRQEPERGCQLPRPPGGKGEVNFQQDSSWGAG